MELFKKEKQDDRNIFTILGVKFSHKKNSEKVVFFENTSLNKLIKAGAVVTDDYYEIEGLKFVNNPCVNPEVIYEILVEKDYFFKTQGMIENSYIVIDVGMNTAIAAVALASEDYVSKVYAFEPLKPTFDIAVKNIQINNLTDKIEAFPYGLGKKDEKIQIEYSPELSVGMSTYYDRHLQDFTLEEIEIKESSSVVGDILGKEKGKKVFLKVDTEGAEFDIFEDLDKSDLLKNIDIVFIEWHFKPKDELINILVKNGFFCFSHQKDTVHNIGYIYAVKNIR